jgi:hypothetical protein
MGAEKVLYADTDSVIVPHRTFPEGIGDQYGEWKHVESWDKIRVLAPKVYGGITTRQAYRAVISGGSPATAAHVDSLLVQGAIDLVGVKKTNWMKMPSSFSSNTRKFSSRAKGAQDTGKIKPIVLNEF